MNAFLYMELANKLAQKESGCLRRKVGAIAIQGENQVVGAGWNTALVKHGEMKSCVECLRSKLNIPSGERHEICNALHAEQMVITNAASNGISLRGATLITTCSPCIICAKMIIAVGFKCVYYATNYPDSKAIEMLKDADVRTIRLDEFQ